MKINPAPLSEAKRKTKDKELALKQRITKIDKKDRDDKLKGKETALLRAAKRSKNNEEHPVAASYSLYIF